MAPKPNAIEVLYSPQNDAQKRLREAWLDDGVRLIICTGPAGTGKTTAALGEALTARQKQRKGNSKLWLSRPIVAVDEELGFLPGDVNAKLLPWLAPFGDCLGSLSNGTLADLAAECELVPLGLLRGRTINHGTLICDEMQNATYSQIVCAATRCGESGRVVLCGDPEQSDLGIQPTPLLEFAKKTKRCGGVRWIEFADADQKRSPFVSELLKCLRKR